MRRLDVRRIVSLSLRGTVYGNPETSPVTERPTGSGRSAPTGVVKVAIENDLLMYDDPPRAAEPRPNQC
jgi:UDP-glucose 4-epimerase